MDLYLITMGLRVSVAIIWLGGALVIVSLGVGADRRDLMSTGRRGRRG